MLEDKVLHAGERLRLRFRTVVLGEQPGAEQLDALAHAYAAGASA